MNRWPNETRDRHLHVHVIAGGEQEFTALVCLYWLTLRTLGLVTETPAQVLQFRAAASKPHIYRGTSSGVRWRRLGLRASERIYALERSREGVRCEWLGWLDHDPGLGKSDVDADHPGPGAMGAGRRGQGRQNAFGAG